MEFSRGLEVSLELKSLSNYSPKRLGLCVCSRLRDLEGSRAAAG